MTQIPNSSSVNRIYYKVFNSLGYSDKIFVASQNCWVCSIGIGDFILRVHPYYDGPGIISKNYLSPSNCVFLSEAGAGFYVTFELVSKTSPEILFAFVQGE